MKHFLCLVILLSACGGGSKPAAEKSEAPAKVSGPVVKETELATIRLSADAEKRLGIQIAEAVAGGGSDVRRFAGEVMLPPGRVVIVGAPVAGTLAGSPAPPVPGSMVRRGQELFALTPLVPLPRDLRVTADAEVQQARTRVETAKLQLARAEKLLRDEVGTVRALEAAKNELDISASALAAAEARLEQIKKAPLDGDVRLSVVAPRDGMVRQVTAAAGQVVAGGAPLFEIADLRGLWIKAAVYAGEAQLVAPRTSVAIESLSGSSLGMASAVAAPPTGDAISSTVDFYFTAPAGAHEFKPGERVTILVSTGGTREGVNVPWSAVTYDVNGGAWVYEKIGERVFSRRRVSLDRTAGGRAYLSSGLRAGTAVVVSGVAELWGTEYGAGK